MYSLRLWVAALRLIVVVTVIANQITRRLIARALNSVTETGNYNGKYI